MSKGIGVIKGGVLKCTQAIYLGQLIERSPHFRLYPPFTPPPPPPPATPDIQHIYIYNVYHSRTLDSHVRGVLTSISEVS